MQLYVAAHDQLGVAAVATLEAIALNGKATIWVPSKKYEESLVIYRASGTSQSGGRITTISRHSASILGTLRGAKELRPSAYDLSRHR